MIELRVGSLEDCEYLNNCTLFHNVLLVITKHVYEDFNLSFLVSIRSIVRVGLLIFDTQQLVIIIIIICIFQIAYIYKYMLYYFWSEHVNITVNCCMYTLIISPLNSYIYIVAL